MAKGFFDESPGNKSQNRLMTFTSLLASIGIATLMVLGFDKSDSGELLFYGFLVGAFAPKLIQKFAEEKLKTKSDD